MRTAFMARPSRASISPSPIGAGEQRGRHFKAERTPDWLDRPWEDEQQVRMRLRPLEIKVSVNYARLSINIVRLANTLKLRRPGAWDRCTAGFQSRLRSGNGTAPPCSCPSQPHSWFGATESGAFHATQQQSP